MDGDSETCIAFFAIIIGLGVIMFLSLGDKNFSPINFCPNACDACVDKVIMTPQDNISACAPVWNQMSSGIAPEFTGLLEQYICYLDWYLRVNSSYPEGFRFFNETGTCETLEKWVSINENHFILRPETYLYTYQIQNAVQFDYCVQEYYKQHFGGDD